MKVRYFYIFIVVALYLLLVWHTFVNVGYMENGIGVEVLHEEKPWSVSSVCSVRNKYTPAANDWVSVQINTPRDIFRSTASSYLVVASATRTSPSQAHGGAMRLLSDARMNSYGGTPNNGIRPSSSASVSSQSASAMVSESVVGGIASTSALLSTLSNSQGFTTVASEISGGELTEDVQSYSAPRRSPGVPSLAPIGDALMPLLLLSLLYMIWKRIQHIKKVRLQPNLF